MKNIIANPYGLDCYEEHGVIYFRATSGGVKLIEYIRRMKNKIGKTFIDEVKNEILSYKFDPSSKREVKFAILKRNLLEHKRGNYHSMEQFANKHKYKRPSVEDAHMIYDILNPDLLKMFGVNWLNIMIAPACSSCSEVGKIPVIYFSKEALRFYFIEFEKYEDCSDDDGFVYIAH